MTPAEAQALQDDATARGTWLAWVVSDADLEHPGRLTARAHTANYHAGMIEVPPGRNNLPVEPVTFWKDICMETYRAPSVSADAIDGDRYHLAQQAELQIRFREVEGQAAKDRAELSAWVQRSDMERPVVPRTSLLEPYLD